MLRSYSCNFHPEFLAVNNCDLCLDLICLKDQRLFISKSYFRNALNNNKLDYSEYIKYKYCPPCYYKERKRSIEIKMRSSHSISEKGFAVSFLFLIMSSFSLILLKFSKEVSYLYYVIIFSIISSLIFAIFIVDGDKKLSKELSKLKNQNEQFLLEIKQLSSTNINSENDVKCFECDFQIEITDKFCPQCGDSTEDEFLALNH